MLITYCQKCHLILHTNRVEDSLLCSECAAGRAPKPRRSRHSDIISRKRLTALNRIQLLQEETDSGAEFPKVIANPEKHDLC